MNSEKHFSRIVFVGFIVMLSLAICLVLVWVLFSPKQLGLKDWIVIASGFVMFGIMPLILVRDLRRELRGEIKISEHRDFQIAHYENPAVERPAASIAAIQSYLNSFTGLGVEEVYRRLAGGKVTSQKWSIYKREETHLMARCARYRMQIFFDNSKVLSAFLEVSTSPLQGLGLEHLFRWLRRIKDRTQLGISNDPFSKVDEYVGSFYRVGMDEARIRLAGSRINEKEWRQTLGKGIQWTAIYPDCRVMLFFHRQHAVEICVMVGR